jgi:hypothetical protein
MHQPKNKIAQDKKQTVKGSQVTPFMRAWRQCRIRGSVPKIRQQELLARS